MRRRSSSRGSAAILQQIAQPYRIDAERVHPPARTVQRKPTATSASGGLIQNTACEPKVSVSQPPSTGPAAAVSADAGAHTPIARFPLLFGIGCADQRQARRGQQSHGEDDRTVRGWLWRTFRSRDKPRLMGRRPTTNFGLFSSLISSLGCSNATLYEKLNFNFIRDDADFRPPRHRRYSRSLLLNNMVVPDTVLGP
jgi:hypothetical protein